MSLKKQASCLVLSALLFISGNVQADEVTLDSGEIAHNYAVRIYYNDDALRLKILTTFEPLEADKQKNYVVVEVDSEEHDKLRGIGLETEIDQQWTETMHRPIPLQVSTLEGLIDAPAAISGYSCYRTVEETFQAAQDIVTNNPALATWSDVGNTWEKDNGLGGYDMMVLKLTNSAVAGPKPKMFVTSSIHAREYAPAELMTRFAEYLVSNYGIDADATWTLDHHEVHLMLMANPDGRKYAEAGYSWRKNTNTNYCGVTSTTRGADLNRNFDYEWGCCGGSSGDQCSLTYRGPTPASEPETQAVQNYLAANFTDTRGPGVNDPADPLTEGVYLDMHSYGELMLWPWGWTSTPAPNGTALQTLGRKLSWFNGHTPSSAIGLYPTDGTTLDYGYGELGIPSYTYELGTAFFQDCSTFENTILPTNLPSLMTVLKTAREPYILPAGPDMINLDLSAGDSSAVPPGSVVTLTATADDTRFNNSNGTEPTQAISSAAYYLDTPPWNGGTAVAMTASDGGFNSSAESVEASIDTTGLSDGQHILYIQGTDAAGNDGIISAIFLNIDSNAVLPTVIFEDDFETDKGWITDPDGSDTATTGQWERANPEDTNSSGPKQLGTTVSGQFDLVTDGRAGTSVGTYDIDNGPTSVSSPAIAIPAGGPYTLSFSYYLAHTSNSSTDDYLRVTVIDSSGTSQVLEVLGAATDRDASWTGFSTNIDAFAGQTVNLQVEAADSGGGSIVEAAIDDVLIEGVVAGSNNAPVIVNPGNQTNAEGDTVSLTVSASDADSDPLTFSAGDLPPGLSINATTGEISGSLSFVSSGVYASTVTVSDGTDTDTAAFSWTVTNVNRAPSATNPGDQTNDEGDSVSLQIVASDPDSDPLNWSATGLPAGLSIDSSGLISGNLDYSASGSYSVTVTVSDGSLSDSIGFNWAVNNVNRAPDATNPGNQSSTEGDSVSLQIVANDPDGDSLGYSAAGLPASLAINTATGLISGSIDSGSAGTYSVTVTASDGTLSDSVSFDWTVVINNDPPVVTNPGNQTSNEGDTVALQIVASDPDGDPLTWSATGLPAGLSIDGSGLIGGTLSYATAGTYSVTVTVSDGIVSESVSFTWTVNDVNRAPSVTTPGDQTNNEGDTVSLQVIASDPDNDPLNWSATGLPAGLAIDNAGLVSGTLSYATSGSYSVTVTASDGALSDSVAFNWTVNDVNRAPTVTNPGNQTNTEGDSVSLQVVASDPDGDTLGYSATGLPPSLTINPSTGLISGNIDAGSAAVYNVTVTASDGNLADTAAFDWTVEEPAGAADIIYVSSNSGGSVGGFGFQDEDILAYDTGTGTWSIFIDGSDIGLSGSGARDINAFAILDDGSMLMSFLGDTSIPDVGAVDDSDLVRFVPTSTGSTTAGSFELYLDGSDVGLANNTEDVDAVHLLANGDLLISTIGAINVTGYSGSDEDLVRFTPTSLGSTTSGNWSAYFDGSDVGLGGNSAEDVWGGWLDESTGDIYITTRAAFSVPGLSGIQEEIFICSPGSLGSTTSCTYSPYWDGAAAGIAGERLDAIFIQR